MRKKAAPQAASGTTGSESATEFPGEELGALFLAWGGTYMFGCDEKGYWAAGHHPGGGMLRAGTPQELGELCAAGFEADPS